jgi:hypothetical protein
MRRAEKGGWGEEVYYSLYRIAVAKAMLNRPWGEIMESFLLAYNSRPIRAEPLYHIAQIYRTKFNMPAIAYMFAKAASDIPFPEGDILFVPDMMYNYAILDELAATAHAAGQFQLGYDVCRRLLLENKIPKSEIPRIQGNLEQYAHILEQMKKQQAAFQQQMKQMEPDPEPEKKKQIKYKERK